MSLFVYVISNSLIDSYGKYIKKESYNKKNYNYFYRIINELIII